MNKQPDSRSIVTVGRSHSRSKANGLSLDMEAQELHQAIHEIPIGDSDEQLTQIDVVGSAGQDGVLMRLDHPIRIKMEGPLGDYAFAFNQDIGGWNTAQVTNMSEMLRSASSFNHYIGDWNTSKVTEFSWIFDSATAFNAKYTCTTLSVSVDPATCSKVRSD